MKNYLIRSNTRRILGTASLLGALVCQILAPSTATAGLFADLNSVVMSNATNPKVLKTTDRTGLFGGTMEVRTPVRSINVVTFDPPRFDAGCGGISLSLGGFSFISGDAIVKTLKNIAANSEGLAFKAAIDAISPNLGHLMEDFQKLLQTMNNHFKNTCSVAKTMMAGPDSILTSAISGGESVAGLKTQFSDMSTALDGYVNDAQGYMNSTSNNNPRAGNINIKQMVASGALTNLAGAGIPNLDGSSDDPTDPNGLNAKVLVSLIGFQMSAVKCTTSDINGNTQGASAAGLGGPLSCSGASTLNLKMLKDGGGVGSTDPTTPLVIWKCLNPQGSVSGGVDNQICTQMGQSSWNYPGFRGYVNTMMFGYADDISINSANITPASIMGSLGTSSQGRGVPLTDTQIQFLNKMGLRKGLLDKSADPSVRITIAVKLSEYVSTCMSARFGQALWQAANMMKTGNSYEPSDEVKRNVSDLQIDYKKEGELCNTSRAIIDSMDLLIKQSQLSDNRK